jgi:hypothetical protein
MIIRGIHAALAACLLLGGCGAKTTTLITTDLTKVNASANAICLKAGATAPILVPIATVAAAAVSPVGAAIVTDADALGKAACASIEAEYKGLQAGSAAPAAPAAAAAPPAPNIALAP